MKGRPVHKLKFPYLSFTIRELATLNGLPEHVTYYHFMKLFKQGKYKRTRVNRGPMMGGLYVYEKI